MCSWIQNKENEIHICECQIEMVQFMVTDKVIETKSLNYIDNFLFKLLFGKSYQNLNGHSIFFLAVLNGCCLLCILEYFEYWLNENHFLFIYKDFFFIFVGIFFSDLSLDFYLESLKKFFFFFAFWRYRLHFIGNWPIMPCFHRFYFEIYIILFNEYFHLFTWNHFFQFI